MTFQRRYKSLSECSIKTQEKHYINYILIYDRMEVFDLVEYYVERWLEALKKLIGAKDESRNIIRKH